MTKKLKTVWVVVRGLIPILILSVWVLMVAALENTTATSDAIFAGSPSQQVAASPKPRLITRVQGAFARLFEDDRATGLQARNATNEIAGSLPAERSTPQAAGSTNRIRQTPLLNPSMLIVKSDGTVVHAKFMAPTSTLGYDHKAFWERQSELDRRQREHDQRVAQHIERNKQQHIEAEHAAIAAQERERVRLAEERRRQSELAVFSAQINAIQDNTRAVNGNSWETRRNTGAVIDNTAELQRVRLMQIHNGMIYRNSYKHNPYIFRR